MGVDMPELYCRRCFMWRFFAGALHAEEGQVDFFLFVSTCGETAATPHGLVFTGVERTFSETMVRFFPLCFAS